MCTYACALNPSKYAFSLFDVLRDPTLTVCACSWHFTGPYTIILGRPAQIYDVIQYADFAKQVSPVRLSDRSSVDKVPDVKELHGLMDGSIKLNTSDLHILPKGAFCGHTCLNVCTENLNFTCIL